MVVWLDESGVGDVGHAGCVCARQFLRSDDRRLRLPVRLPPRPESLFPTEFRPVELFLHALERGVADRAVVPQRHEAPPLGLGRRAHDRRVGIRGPDEQHYRVAA
jgi:hypothetical protein